MQKLKKLHLYDFILLMLLCFLFVCIGDINFSRHTSFYNADMYSDILYAVKAWEQRSVFPEGWVFGNQLYVAATPVLAAVFYGITAEPVISMSLASTVMAALVIVSFYWMLIPCFPDRTPRIFACIFAIVLPLKFGDAVYEFNGWQLLFTMCSYYACYAITGFWAFGLYIRNWRQTQVVSWPSLVFLCCFSFFMGMQSLRQTLIMVLPLIAMEWFGFVGSWYGKRKLFGPSTLVCALVVVSNLAGVLFSRILSVEAFSILGDFSLTAFSFSNLEAAFTTIKTLFHSGKPMLCVALIYVCGTVLAMYHCKCSKTGCAVVLQVLMMLSVSAVVAVDVLSTMEIRFIYYFLIYPLNAYLAGWLLMIPHRIGRTVARGLLICVLVVTVSDLLVFHAGLLRASVDLKEEQGYEEASVYLTEAGYHTVFADSSLGYKLAIASDLELRAGLWFEDDPFHEIRYLCDPAIFDAEPEHCAYAFRGSQCVSGAWEKLVEYGLEMELLVYFPDCDLYVFTSEDPLISLID